MAENNSSKVIQYGTALEYAIGENQTEISVGGLKMILTSLSVSSEGEAKPYKDNSGKTCTLVIPEQYPNVTCEGLIKKGGAGTLPKKGDQVSGLPSQAPAGYTYRVESCSQNWANEDVAKVSITVRGYTF